MTDIFASTVIFHKVFYWRLCVSAPESFRDGGLGKSGMLLIGLIPGRRVESAVDFTGGTLRIPQGDELVSQSDIS